MNTGKNNFPENIKIDDWLLSGIEDNFLFEVLKKDFEKLVLTDVIVVEVYALLDNIDTSTLDFKKNVPRWQRDQDFLKKQNTGTLEISKVPLYRKEKIVSFDDTFALNKIDNVKVGTFI